MELKRKIQWKKFPKSGRAIRKMYAFKVADTLPGGDNYFKYFLRT